MGRDYHKSPDPGAAGGGVRRAGRAGGKEAGALPGGGPPPRDRWRPRFLRLLPLILVYLLLAVLAVREVGNPDVGFHLKAGEYLLAGHGWPRNDPFTFTLRDRPYIDTSWGYQVMVAAVEKAAGSPGLVLFHALLVLGIFLLLGRTAWLAEADSLSAAVFLLLGGLASEIRFEVRPELLSWLFLAVVLHLLHRRALSLPAPLWTLPILFLVWANCHSLFILGWAALGCFVAGGWMRRRRLDRPLLGWSLASVAVTFLNPYGARGVLFPFTLATRMEAGNPFAQSIGEFVSPFALRISEQFPFFPKIPVYSFRVLAILALISLPVLFLRKRWDLFLLTGGFFVLAAEMIRNMPLLVIAAYPALVWSLPAEKILEKLGAGPGARRKLVPAGLALVTLAAGVLALRVVHDSYYIASRRPARFGLGWNRRILPLGAADFALKAGLTGPVLNHLNFGGTLMWRLPQPVFIDGRLEVVGERFYEEYRRALSSEQGLEAMVSRYGIRWLVFPYAINAALLKQLSRDSRWRLAYVDDLSVIFVRVAPGEAAPVDPALASLLGAPATGPPPIPVNTLPGLGGGARAVGVKRWLEGLVRREEFPSLDFNLGLFHFFRGEPIRAERRFSAAIRESGGAYYEMYADLAATLYWQHRYPAARNCDLIVLEDDPGNRLALDRLSRTGGR